MKKKLLSVFMLLLAIHLWSQKGVDSDYTVSVNGHKITTTANFKQQFKAKKSTSKQNPTTEYTLLQFSKIPSVEEQEKLKSQGITLLSYLSNNAYYAAIDSDFYNKSSASDNILSLIHI